MTPTSRGRATPPDVGAPNEADDTGAPPRTQRILLPGHRRGLSRDHAILVAVVTTLVGLGVIMVQSATSVRSLLDHQSGFDGLIRQGSHAAVGLVALAICSRLPAAFWRRWSWLLLVAGFLVQLLVYTPLGYASGGNRNWIAIGSFTAQPSEAMKLAVIVWAAAIYGRKEHLLDRWGHSIVPLLPVVGLSMTVNLIGGDLGTVIIMAAICLGLMFFAGIRLRIIALVAAAGAVMVLAMTIAKPNRMMRVLHYFQTDCATDSESYFSLCWQPLHGLWALANGGVLGVGVGNSSAKWSWLPAADNDYILAIAGEELGLIGTLLVLALFTAIALVLARLVLRSDDLFAQVVTGGVLVWLLSQALVNIAVVLGFLPVLGVPLPFVSSGGTSLISTLTAIGVVLSVTRERRAFPAPTSGDALA